MRILGEAPPSDCQTGTELILESRRVVPGRLLQRGFVLRFATWEAAARDLCQVPMLREYPYLEAEDIAEALSYAAWRAEEVEVPPRQP